MNKMHP